MAETFWVALGLFILIGLGWYYGRESIKGAMFARVRRIEAEVGEVKDVLQAARVLHEETKERHVALEREIQEISKNSVIEAQSLCEDRYVAFKERLANKERQIEQRMYLERQKQEEKLRQKILALAFQGFEDRLAKKREGNLTEKAQTEKARRRLEEVFSVH